MGEEERIQVKDERTVGIPETDAKLFDHIKQCFIWYLGDETFPVFAKLEKLERWFMRNEKYGTTLMIKDYKAIENRAWNEFKEIMESEPRLCA